MCKGLAVLLGVAVFLGFLAGSTPAATIIDTGPGPNQTNGWALDNLWWHAGEFTMEAHTVTSVEGWMCRTSTNNNPVYAVIYAANGEIPGSILFEKDFTVSNRNSAGWYGASGLDWTLPAGTYWVGFEVRTSGFTGSQPSPATTPLGDEAYYSSAGAGWFQHDAANLGYRIMGNPVPVPGAIWLFGSGLLGLWGLRKQVIRTCFLRVINI
jgi:hypothetical protein